MTKFYENRFTGELLKTTKEKFDELGFNRNEWDEISEYRYNQLKELAEGGWIIGK